MKALPATPGTSEEHYCRLGLSRDYNERWEDGMGTDGGKGTREIPSNMLIYPSLLSV